MALRYVTGLILLVWLALVIAGKGGHTHLLLLTAIGVGATEAVATYRGRMAE